MRILEKKFSVIEKAVKHNNNEIVEVQHKVENLEKSIRILKEKQSVSVKADELEIRLKAMENKLNQCITERVNITDVVANASTATTDDRLLLIKNLPYGMKDIEDVVKLIHEGMGLDISVKSIQRAPSVYNRAGVLTVELHSKDDKMKILANKSKLRQSIDYYNVYLENTNSAVDMRIEEQIKMLVNNVQMLHLFSIHVRVSILLHVLAIIDTITPNDNQQMDKLQIQGLRIIMKTEVLS